MRIEIDGKLINVSIFIQFGRIHHNFSICPQSLWKVLKLSHPPRSLNYPELGEVLKHLTHVKLNGRPPPLSLSQPAKVHSTRHNQCWIELSIYHPFTTAAHQNSPPTRPSDLQGNLHPQPPHARLAGRSVTRGAHVPRGRTVVDQQAAGVHELVWKYSESTLCRKNKIKIHKNRPTLTPTRHEITYDSSTVDKLLRIFWQHKNVSSTSSPMCCCGHHNIISLANQRRGDEWVPSLLSDGHWEINPIRTSYLRFGWIGIICS